MSAPRLLARLDAGRPPQADALGWRCFQLAVFVLPASALFAGLLLLAPLIQGSRRRAPWWHDRVNVLWMLTAALMVVGAAALTFRSQEVPDYPVSLAWFGLFNWLPFFWAFWAFQPYLADGAARRRVALALVAGTVPVLATGLGQLLLGWHGPWQILGGAVIWHLKEGGNPTGRLSGLFDYANITAAWLALSWPLLLAALISCWRRWRDRLAGSGWRLLVVLLLVVAQVASMVLTDSRNAWGVMVTAVPLVAGPASWIWMLPLLALALLPVALATLPGVPALLQDSARAVVPQSIWGRLNDFNHHGHRRLASLRITQWSVAASLIAERPWLGWGAAAFSVIYPLRTGRWHGHTHNISIDLAFSYGLPVGVLVVGLVLWLHIRGVRQGMLQGPVFDRAWWTAAFMLAVLHATDIPTYDSRVNIAGWILLAGLRCWSR